MVSTSSASTVKELSPSQVRLQAVARALGLTDTQRDQLSGVAENVATTLQRLDEQWRNDPPQERARKQQLLAEAAQREIMSFLSEEQQQHSKDLSSLLEAEIPRWDLPISSEQC